MWPGLSQGSGHSELKAGLQDSQEHRGLVSLARSKTAPGSDLWQPQQVEGRRAGQGGGKACLCLSDPHLGPCWAEGAVMKQRIHSWSTRLSSLTLLLPPLLPPTPGCICPTQVFSGNEAFLLEASPCSWGVESNPSPTS